MHSFKFIFILFLFISCNSRPFENEINQIHYGTSFGQCLGFCINEMSIGSEFIIFRKEGYDGNTYQKRSCSKPLQSELANSINKFDQFDAFFNLPETIGCPDCADGGAEWLEIELNNGNKHKVTFEYFNEPTVIMEIIQDLRIQMNESIECG